MYIAKYHEHTKNLHLPVLKMMKIDEDWLEDQLNSLFPPLFILFLKLKVVHLPKLQKMQ